jgi:hypothetical protein
VSRGHHQLLLAQAVAGPGVAGGRLGAPVQSSGTFEANNVSTAQTFNMGANFTPGNSVIYVHAHYQLSGVGVASVVINGITATKFQVGGGSVALLEFYRVDNVTGGSSSIVVTFTSGTGHYVTGHAAEFDPLGAVDVVAQSNATSTTPGSTVTTAATAQPETLTYGAYRDDTGVNNTATTPIPATLFSGFLERDGINKLGGASGFRFEQRIGTQNTTFSSVSTLWYETIVTIKRTLPVTLLSTQKQDWVADNAWVPTTATVTTASGDVLVSVGAWWNDTGTHPVPIPTDSNGTFVATVNPDISPSENPVSVQFCHEATPAVGSHTVTPASLAIGGDGYFWLVKLTGVDTSAPIRDTGRTRNWHAIHSPPDPATIQSITVTTAGALAQVGDFCLMAVVMDPNSTSNTDVAFVPPAGWWVVAVKYNCADNVGAILLAAKVTAAGQISATVTWTDPNTFVADVTMVVYKHL